MDNLVLLAQMHGSGPDTVKALRASGIETAQDVAALDPEELGRLAGLKAAAARKMSEEARRMVGAAVGADGGEGGEAADAAVPAGAPSAVTARMKRRRTLAEIEARARKTCVSESDIEGESLRAGQDLDEGVSSEEASVIRRTSRTPAPAPRSDDPARWLPSFWRFG